MKSNTFEMLKFDLRHGASDKILRSHIKIFSCRFSQTSRRGIRGRQKKNYFYLATAYEGFLRDVNTE